MYSSYISKYRITDNICSYIFVLMFFNVINYLPTVPQLTHSPVLLRKDCRVGLPTTFMQHWGNVPPRTGGRLRLLQLGEPM